MFPSHILIQDKQFEVYAEYIIIIYHKPPFGKYQFIPKNVGIIFTKFSAGQNDRTQF